MGEELGKIEKMPAEGYRKGRKLFFIPLVYSGTDMPAEFTEIFERYWGQVAKQIEDLAAKLGEVNRIYHELVSTSGEAGEKTIKELSPPSHKIVKVLQEKKAALEALEEVDILTEYMDWNRCLLIGLQNPDVLKKVYDAYIEAGKKRNESLARRINETLKEDESAVLLLRENHQVQFPADIRVFYVAPPALDEIKRWLRERENKAESEEA